MTKRPLRNQAGQTLEEFLSAYRPKDYPHPSVTVDLLVLSLEKEKPELLMIRRGNHPELGCWALPGGFVEPNEFAEDAAARELREETHVEGLPLTELGLFSGPDRDPRGWTMSNAYLAVANRSALSVQADDDAADTGWFAVDYRLESGVLHLTLTGSEETLTAVVQIREQAGALGPDDRVESFRADGIAFDHSKMIASAVLKLRRAGILAQ